MLSDFSVTSTPLGMDSFELNCFVLVFIDYSLYSGLFLCVVCNLGLETSL